MMIDGTYLKNNYSLFIHIYNKFTKYRQLQKDAKN